METKIVAEILVRENINDSQLHYISRDIYSAISKNYFVLSTDTTKEITNIITDMEFDNPQPKGEPMPQQYRAKTKQDKVYLRGLLKDEKDEMHSSFVDFFAKHFGRWIETKSFLDQWINQNRIEQSWIDWLCRQDIIELVEEKFKIGDFYWQDFPCTPVKISYLPTGGIVGDIENYAGGQIRIELGKLKRFKFQGYAKECFEKLQKLYQSEKE
jgi:hypothetical protein